METLINDAERILGSLLDQHAWLRSLFDLSILLVAAVLSFFITRRYLLRALARIIRSSRVRWDDALLEKKVLSRASVAAPVLVIYYGISLVTGVSPAIAASVERVALAVLALVVLITINALLTAVNEVYSQLPVSKGRPIKGYIQIVNIFIFLIGGILIIAQLLGKSPWHFVTGIGAMTAVLLLIFRDTILSFVASIQIVSYEMVRIGDWIEMPKYGADGDVIDIALHTIKVQNFDKTIITIPTHKLIEDSFKNWRGMSESGGRRIKRAIHIDMSSVHFLSGEEIERFSRFDLLRDYIEQKKEELGQEKRQQDGGSSLAVNERRLTNVGTFRAYIVSYLRQHPDIHAEGMTFLIRQLQPGPEGLPIQIYVFTRTTAWVRYEEIQADIFDHLLAIIPEFGLRVFQEPTGHDLKELRPGAEHSTVLH
jgi:miniconductance mechanosensitive channel